MADSRVSSRAPLVILCQHDHGSCAACCGLYNFVDKDGPAFRARVQRRTDLVQAAWPDPTRLAAVRDQLLAEEAPTLLFSGVKSCPFAGYVDADADRVGCLLHPSRHPTGSDLRDLAVYPREVCAGHFCASHDWLRPRDVALAQGVRGPRYGRVVTDAGLVKAVAAAVADVVGGVVDAAAFGAASADVDAFFAFVVDAWPYKDPDPRRFGGFFFDGDDARDRSLPSCLLGATVSATSPERQILDAIGTRALSDDEAREALRLLREHVARLAAAVSSSTSSSSSSTSSSIT
jgi:hypothetical protein